VKGSTALPLVWPGAASATDTGMPAQAASKLAVRYESDKGEKPKFMTWKEQPRCILPAFSTVC